MAFVEEEVRKQVNAIVDKEVLRDPSSDESTDSKTSNEEPDSKNGSAGIGGRLPRRILANETRQTSDHQSTKQGRSALRNIGLFRHRPRQHRKCTLSPRYRSRHQLSQT